MTNISEMKAELIKNGVSASVVARMTEKQLIKACEERDIEIRETLNNNGNWGRGDEVEISTDKQQVDPYTQKYNRAVEKKDAALAASWKYLKEGNLGLAFSYLGDAVERGYDVSTMPKDMKDAYTQKGSALKLLGVGALLGLFATSCEVPEPEPEPEKTTSKAVVNVPRHHEANDEDIQNLGRKSLEDINKFLDAAVLRAQKEILSNQDDIKGINQQKNKLLAEQRTAVSNDNQDRLIELGKTIQGLNGGIVHENKRIILLKNDINAINKTREKFMQELNQTVTLEDRANVLKKEEYSEIVGMLVTEQLAQERSAEIEKYFEAKN